MIPLVRSARDVPDDHALLKWARWHYVNGDIEAGEFEQMVVQIFNGARWVYELGCSYFAERAA
jgi:hypothetical protein